MRDPFPAFNKVLDGPWDDPLSVVGGEDGMPTSPARIMALAKQHGWGFGVVSLVMRMNHPHEEVPPFFMSWHFNIETGRWSFHSAAAANMQRLNARDCKLVIEHPQALLPEDPNEPRP
jgi:hypothetical protein